MLSDRIGAKARGLQDQPPLSVAEKLLLLVCAAALVLGFLFKYGIRFEKDAVKMN